MEGKPTILIAADHAGYALKGDLIPTIEALGYSVEDLGATKFDPEDDYPDLIFPLAEKVAKNPEQYRGIAIGGSGQGEAMVANRVKGARAMVYYGERPVSASLEIEGGASQDGYDNIRLARRHNDSNILSIGARFMSVNEATEAVRVFLETPFTGPERHARRLAKF